MRITTRTRYGTRLMVQLAMNYRRGYMAIKDVVAQEKVSKKYLERILYDLKSHGLVKTTRGVKGGYRLTLPPNKIKVADIFVALEGPVQLVNCHANYKCNLVRTCVTRDLWYELSRMIEKKLKSMTLARLARRKTIKEKKYE
ncbi:hypothetical protein A2Y85_01120 [candidate division WOR-3 bacterium RBG_13_43_14]|uniref:Rrf2 family transcriptional regulator n=1 Tax=candidate division WOR-3 bacterium RBG_13_43_14 TaxID=1802590 RepID=A0A1F4UG76_UNCW3|nr:MAG: hypothetical protein A2Y85_01120 [candidate division WOR-3 bacterium RBG_13_43_14]